VLKPSNTSLCRENWNLAVDNLVQYIGREVKNEIGKDQLKEIASKEISVNQRNVLIIVGLHAALFSRKQVQPSAKQWKITLPEAHKFMILHCKTENSLDIEIEKRRKVMIENKATFQPMIAVFGDSLSSSGDKFCIIFDDIKYFSTDFINALTTLLKIYELFGLAFPGPSINVFHFLRSILLGINTRQADSKVLNLYKIISNET
jgi:hypothetical protein